MAQTDIPKKGFFVNLGLWYEEDDRRITYRSNFYCGWLSEKEHNRLRVILEEFCSKKEPSIRR